MAAYTSWRRLLVAAGSVAVVVVAFAFVLPRLASYGEVWRSLQRLSWPWIAALVASTAVNVLTFALPWMVALPGLRFLNALSLTQASTAVSLVVPGGAPVGMAASFAMLRSWGLAGRSAGLAVALTGIWSQLSTFLFPLMAAGLLAVTGAVSGQLEVTAITGVVLVAAVFVLLAAALLYPAAAYRIGEGAAGIVSRLRRLVRRPPVVWGGAALVRFRAESLDLVRHRWAVLTIATAANQLTGFVMFELSLRAVGVSYGQVSPAESFAGWSVARLLSSLPITPGGIGVVEIGMAGMLIGFGGPSGSVAAAVLIYRFLSIVPTILLGLVATATWRLQTPRLSRPPTRF